MVAQLSRATASVASALIAAQQRTLHHAAIHTSARARLKGALHPQQQRLQQPSPQSAHTNYDAQALSVHDPCLQPSTRLEIGSYDASPDPQSGAVLEGDEAGVSKVNGSPSTVPLECAEQILQRLISPHLHLPQMTEFLASRRKRAGFGKPESFEEFFSFLPPQQARSARSFVEGKLSTHTLPDVWLCFVNVIAYCASWDECVSQVRRVAAIIEGEADKNGQGSAERKDVFCTAKVWPSFVLSRAIRKVTDAAEAEDALKTLGARLLEMPVAHSVSCLNELDKKMHLLVAASHLVHRMTDLTLQLASRILQMPDDVVKRKKLPLPQAGDSVKAITSLFILHHGCLKRASDVDSGREIKRMVQWAESEDRIHVDAAKQRTDSAEKMAIAERLRRLAAQLRMRMLGVVSRDAAEDNPEVNGTSSQETDWAHADSPTSSMTAYEIVEHFSFNDDHSGKGLELAFERAVKLSEREKNPGRAAQLADMMQMAVEQGKLDKSMLLSPTILRAYVASDQKNEAWQVFREMVRSGELQHRNDADDGESTESVLIDRSSSSFLAIIGMAARDETAPLDMVMDLAGFEGDSVGIAQQGERPNMHLFSTLLSNLPKRRNEEGYEATQRVWDCMRLKNIKPDSQCVGAYCQYLIRTGHSDEAIELLEERAAQSHTMSKDWRLAKSVLTALVDVMEAKKVYEVYQILHARLRMRPHARHLECLLRAARMITEEVLRHGTPRQRRRHALRIFFDSESEELRLTRLRVHEQSIWDGIPAAERTRAIFRRILFHQHPTLLQAINPLSDEEAPRFDGDGKLTDAAPYQHSFAWRQERAMLKMQAWITDRFDRLSHSHDTGDGGAQSTSSPTTSATQSGTPSPVFFTFDAPLFHHYLELIPLVQRNVEEKRSGRTSDAGRVAWDERFLVLSWMRALGVVPLHKSLCLLCLHVDEMLPPSHDLGSAGDDDNASAAGPLHHYLAQWLGQRSIPSREDVGHYFIQRQKDISRYKGSTKNL